MVTDREDLDGQDIQEFLNTGTVRQADAAQPKNGEQMKIFERIRGWSLPWLEISLA